jgi:hypothetical protein
MDGSQEVPPSGSPAVGLGQTLIDTNTNTLFYHISYSGLVGTETAAHIHGFSPPGVNSGVVHTLPAGNPKVGAWVYTNAQEASILAGLTYINIHTTANPGGEIRGQILVDPSTDLVALIDPGQEVPPNPPGGLGIGVFDIDTAANTLAYDIRFGNLTGTETAAHIHGPAPPGVNAGVLHGLGTGSPKIGVWNYLPAEEPHILGGLTYVNIHTTFDAGGEIRGQILGSSPTVGVSELPPRADALGLHAVPNPVREGSTVLFYRVPVAGKIEVTIHDVHGRVVRRLLERSTETSGTLAWDLRQDGGTRVGAGVYFAKLRSAEGEKVTRITVLH